MQMWVQSDLVFCGFWPHIPDRSVKSTKRSPAPTATPNSRPAWKLVSLPRFTRVCRALWDRPLQDQPPARSGGNPPLLPRSRWTLTPPPSPCPAARTPLLLQFTQKRLTTLESTPPCPSPTYCQVPHVHVPFCIFKHRVSIFLPSPSSFLCWRIISLSFSFRLYLYWFQVCSTVGRQPCTLQNAPSPILPGPTRPYTVITLSLTVFPPLYFTPPERTLGPRTCASQSLRLFAQPPSCSPLGQPSLSAQHLWVCFCFVLFLLFFSVVHIYVKAHGMCLTQWLTSLGAAPFRSPHTVISHVLCLPGFHINKCLSILCSYTAIFPKSQCN